MSDPEGELLPAGELGSGDSGIAEVGGSFSSALSIFGCQVFIARGSRAAPDLVSGGVVLSYTIGMTTFVDWILGRGEMLPSRKRFERGLVEVLRASSSDALRMTSLPHPPNSLSEGVIEGGEGGHYCSFGAQDLLA